MQKPREHRESQRRDVGDASKGSAGVNEAQGVGRDNQGIMSFSENEM